MRVFLIFLITFLWLIPFAYTEPVFEKDYRTSNYPETKIIRYRILGHHKGQEGYAVSFTGKIIKGQVTIQIEDTHKNIIEKREIPSFSVIHWHFLLPREIGLENVYMVFHWNNAIGNIYSVVAPAIQPRYIYTSQTILFALTLFFLFASAYIIWKKSLPMSWLIWGVILGFCAKILYYISDYFDFLPTTLLINSTVNEGDISEYIFATYISLRETAILFLLLSIFSEKWFSIKQKSTTSISISLGLTFVFLISIVVSGIQELLQLRPNLQFSNYSLALLSVQASHTPLFCLLIPLRNTILSGLWFSSFYLTIFGTINANKKVVLLGILIFILTEAVLVYFEKSYFICRYSNWWKIVILILISFIPLFLLKSDNLTNKGLKA